MSDVDQYDILYSEENTKNNEFLEYDDFGEICGEAMDEFISAHQEVTKLENDVYDSLEREIKENSIKLIERLQKYGELYNMCGKYVFNPFIVRNRRFMVKTGILNHVYTTEYSTKPCFIDELMLCICARAPRLYGKFKMHPCPECGCTMAFKFWDSTRVQMPIKEFPLPVRLEDIGEILADGTIYVKPHLKKVLYVRSTLNNCVDAQPLDGLNRDVMIYYDLCTSYGILIPFRGN